MSGETEDRKSKRTTANETQNSNSSDPEQFLPLPELAERWRVSVKTVRRIVARGELPVHRIGVQLRVSLDAARNYEKLNRS